MSKSILTDIVAGQLDTTKAEAGRVIDAVAAGIATVVGDRGETIRLPGLGSFKRVHKPARDGRNPQTGDAIRIAARDAIVFKSARKGEA